MTVLESGAPIGSYQVVRRLGEGDLADVYEVSHRRSGARYAAKLVHADAQVNGVALQRFRREVEATSALHHLHIAQVQELGVTADGRTFVVWQYLAGTTLAERMAEAAPLSVLDVLDIVESVVGALSAADSVGVVHRNLTPANIMLVPRAGDDREVVKLLDFGVSTLREFRSRSTRNPAAAGHAGYLSPEQARGRLGEVDARSDQFVLAAITYEMLSGRPAFTAESSAVTLARVARVDPQPLAELNPAVPQEMAVAIHRALSKVAEGRFPSSFDFLRALCRPVLGLRPAPRLVLDTEPAPVVEAAVPEPVLVAPTAVVVPAEVVAPAPVMAGSAPAVAVPVAPSAPPVTAAAALEQAPAVETAPAEAAPVAEAAVVAVAVVEAAPVIEVAPVMAAPSIVEPAPVETSIPVEASSPAVVQAPIPAPAPAAMLLAAPTPTTMPADPAPALAAEPTLPAGPPRSSVSGTIEMVKVPVRRTEPVPLEAPIPLVVRRVRAQPPPDEPALLLAGRDDDDDEFLRPARHSRAPALAVTVLLAGAAVGGWALYGDGGGMATVAKVAKVAKVAGIAGVVDSAYSRAVGGPRWVVPETTATASLPPVAVERAEPTPAAVPPSSPATPEPSTDTKAESPEVPASVAATAPAAEPESAPAVKVVRRVLPRARRPRPVVTDPVGSSAPTSPSASPPIDSPAVALPDPATAPGATPEGSPAAPEPVLPATVVPVAPTSDPVVPPAPPAPALPAPSSPPAPADSPAPQRVPAPVAPPLPPPASSDEA